MAYFIFLKSLRSLGEFRKNPHVKIPPKSPCAYFQSLGIFKNQILFEKEFSHHFWPSSLSAQPRPIFFLFNRPSPPPPSPVPTGPRSLGRPSPPSRPNQLPSSSSRTVPPPRSTPTTPPEEKKWPHQSPFIPPLIGAISPSSITGNQRFQPGPLKVLGLPRLASAL
jgi:hypothetical protein